MIVILGGVPAFELFGVSIDELVLLIKENSLFSSSVMGKGFILKEGYTLFQFANV